MLEIDGLKVYGKCTKKAAVIRELETHVPWFATDFIFLFSNYTKFSSIEKEVDPNDTYSRALDPAYGYVNINISLDKNDFRIHCFNLWQGKNDNGDRRCNDMEITYYVECDEIEEKRSSRNLRESCLANDPTVPPSDKTAPTAPPS